LVFDIYGVRADYPFEESFKTNVFRHGNGKWFALAMNIGGRKIGHNGDKKIDVVNLKCAPEVIESLAGIESSIYHAYRIG
jgi:predicted DNA-binding protein (MmcQ/YjbR family)